MNILPIILLFVLACCANALLYPQRNELRGLEPLDGLWTFVREPADFPGIGLQNEWFKRDLSRFPNATRMPVPAAFNDLSPERELRMHVGWVWYSTSYRVPLTHTGRRLIVRFGSVNYYARVYVNGVLAQTHTGGHLPFDVELVDPANTRLFFITVAVNNTLHSGTIPPGELLQVRESNVSFVSQIPDFDFFNYAGILRPVVVQSLGKTFLHKLKIYNVAQNEFAFWAQLDTNLSETPKNQRSQRSTGPTGPSAKNTKISVCLFAPDGLKLKCVAAPKQFGPLDDVQLWWPRGYGEQPLYTLEVSTFEGTEMVDVYRETFGFRTVKLVDNRLHINGKPTYCKGFGMHEDFELYGRGFSRVVLTRDLNTFEWMHANCYRTSHYPYSEERAFEADRRGIITITETPAVGLRYFTEENRRLHETMLVEMIERDFNHPSVIAWSLANEPQTYQEAARDYFQKLYLVANATDKFRPITTVYGPTSPWNERTADLMDFICVNKYYGWYQSLDHPEVVENQMHNYIAAWHDHFQKPIVVTEYGAEALPGYYMSPSMPFSEQYQLEIIEANHRAFDRFKNESLITGEMIWNFADFMTAGDKTRPLGNHKGVLTRNRQPKQAAYVIQKRYGRLTGV